MPSLSRLVRRIQNPSDYFAGLNAPSLLLPENVLLFQRRAIPGQGKSHHHRHVLIVSIEAAGRIVVDDAVFHLQPGHVLMVFPFQFHGYQPMARTKLLWLFITFEGEFADQLDGFRRGPLKLSRKAAHWMGELLAAYNAETHEHRAQAVQFLSGLLLNELRSTAEQTLGKTRAANSKAAPGTQDLPGAVCRFIQKNMERGARIKDLARHLKISASNLRAAFRKSMGMPLGQYLAELRLLRAASLLHSSELRLWQIAQRCGYDSAFSLSRAFKRKMGQSPREYRKARRS
ncbi:MAG TPA: AraC family transcriptional regulator [Planctomycetota bacterium]|nr:AraC family transcriptional regulator [Planctomycetota bacterium]